MKTRRRGRRLVPGSFQSRFLVVSILHYFAIVLTFVSILFFPLMIQLDDPAMPLEERLEFANQFLSLHQRVWPALLVVLSLLVIHLVFFSHRFAGPLYRWKQVFRQIAEGDLTVVTTIRAADYLHEEVGALNGMVGALRTRIGDVKTQAARARATCVELERALASRPDPEAAAQLRALTDQLGLLEKDLGTFRTADPTDQGDPSS